MPLHFVDENQSGHWCYQGDKQQRVKVGSQICDSTMMTPASVYGMHPLLYDRVNERSSLKIQEKTHNLKWIEQKIFIVTFVYVFAVETNSMKNFWTTLTTHDNPCSHNEDATGADCCFIHFNETYRVKSTAGPPAPQHVTYGHESAIDLLPSAHTNLWNCLTVCARCLPLNADMTDYNINRLPPSTALKAQSRKVLMLISVLIKLKPNSMKYSW